MTENGADEKTDKFERLNEIYLAIIGRYRDYIEGRENLSVAELSNLVTPRSEKVGGKAEEIKRGFTSYVYERDFKNASTLAYEFVKNDIENIVLPVQFWLTPEETLTYRMGDVIDKNLLLCSILIRLGNPSAKVLVRIKENVRKVLVYYELDNRIHVLDVGDGTRDFDSKDDMLKTLEFDDETTAYEFNNQTYTDIT